MIDKAFKLGQIKPFRDFQQDMEAPLQFNSATFDQCVHAHANECSTPTSTTLAVSSFPHGQRAIRARFLAGGAAVRQLALATRRQGWRGFVGRTNGGMIVHIGVVIVAVGLAGAGAFAEQTEARLAPGETRTVTLVANAETPPVLSMTPSQLAQHFDRASGKLPEVES